MSFSAWLLGLLNRAPVPAEAPQAEPTTAQPPPSPPAAATGRCNAAGRALIKSFEQCRLTAYLDSGGVWTIGWGHTGAYPTDRFLWIGWGLGSVGRGDRISQEQADDLFERDLAAAEQEVKSALPGWWDLTDNMFSALCSFQFNTGSMPTKCPTLMRELREGEYAMVPAALRQWCHDEGKVVAGLVRRRQAEVDLWQTS